MVMGWSGPGILTDRVVAEMSLVIHTLLELIHRVLAEDCIRITNPGGRRLRQRPRVSSGRAVAYTVTTIFPNWPLFSR